MITSISEKAKVVIMGCGHQEYWPQFLNMREKLISSTKTFSGYVKKNEAELMEYRFLDDIFVEDWCKALPCHHVSLSIGHNSNIVEKLGKLMVLETIRVR